MNYVAILVLSVSVVDVSPSTSRTTPTKADRAVGIALDAPHADVPRPERRKALVIGNAAYPESPLKNTLNDAFAVAGALRALGFAVTLETNTDLKSMRRTLGNYIDAIRKDDISIFFYAGHGVEIDGTNYLVSTDFQAQRAADVPYDAFPVNQFLDGLERQDPAVNVVILDACRNNPFNSGTRAFGKRGLAEVHAGTGSLIAFATSPGKTASDGEDKNGAFTSSLIRFLQKPGMDIEAMFKEVSDDVAIKTRREQIPWRSSSIVGKYYLAGAGPALAVEVKPPPGGSAIPRVRVSERSGLTYVWIPGGVFEAGCLPGRSSCDADEVPPRTVNVGEFYLLTTEVTVDAYHRCVAAGACNALDDEEARKPTCNFSNPMRGDHPINCLTWDEARAFCAWDGGRLPSPEEWEFAASAGGSQMYPWGNEGVDGCRANYCDKKCLDALGPNERAHYVNRGWADVRHDDGWSVTAPVGSFPAGANPWSVHDLLGNVSEWTAGFYTASAREVRGGDWASEVGSLRASNRSKSIPGYRSDMFGARCAQ